VGCNDFVDVRIVEELQRKYNQLRARNEKLVEALQFYAEQNHLSGDGTPWEEWDTVSGEPQNWLCGPDDWAGIVESGGIARGALENSSDE